jgi:hypothetical protein
MNKLKIIYKTFIIYFPLRVEYKAKYAACYGNLPFWDYIKFKIQSE